MKRQTTYKRRLLCFLTAALVVFALGATACGREPDSSGNPAVTTIATSRATGEVTDPEGTDPDGTDPAGSGSEETTASAGNDGTGTTTTRRGGIIQTRTTERTATTTVNIPRDLTVKEEILSKVTPAMKGKTVTIMSWWPTGDSETQKAKQFEKESGIKVKYEPAAGVAILPSTLAARINAGNSPDAVVINGYNYPAMVIKNYFQPLTVAKLDLNQKFYEKELMETFKWENKNYGAITKNGGGNFLVCFYNNTLFKSKGVKSPGTLYSEGKWNWDTFTEAAKSMTSASNGLYGVELYYKHFLITSCGIDFVTVKNGKIDNNMKSDSIYSGYKFVNELANTHKVVGAGGSFAQAKTAMMIGWSWQANESEAIYKTLKDDWSMVPVPNPKGTKQAIPMEVQAGGIPVGAKNPVEGLIAYNYIRSADVVTDGAMNPWAHRPELEMVMADIWNTTKIPMISPGVIDYGGDYSSGQFSEDAIVGGESNIQASIDKWYAIININKNRILSDFS